MSAYLSIRRSIEAGAHDPGSQLLMQGRQLEARRQSAERDAWKAVGARG